jgi:uncharacterized alpha-E superfamily protein
MVTWFLPILSVIVGAALAFAFARIGARQERKSEHAKWLRERRFEAYRDFIASADKWSTRGENGSSAEPGQEFYDEMVAAEAAVELLGPPSVVAAMDPIRSALLNLQGAPDATSHRALAAAYWSHQRAFMAIAQRQVWTSSK